MAHPTLCTKASMGFILFLALLAFVLSIVINFVFYAANASTNNIRTITHTTVIDANGTDIFQNVANMSAAEIWSVKYCLAGSTSPDNCITYSGDCATYGGCLSVDDLHVNGHLYLNGPDNLIFQLLRIGDSNWTWVDDHVEVDGGVHLPNLLLPIHFDNDSFASLSRTALTENVLELNSTELRLNAYITTVNGTQFSTPIYIGNMSILRYDTATGRLLVAGYPNGVFINQLMVNGLFQPIGTVVGTVKIGSNGAGTYPILRFIDATGNGIESPNGPLKVCSNGDLTFEQCATNGMAVFTMPVRFDGDITGNVHIPGTLQVGAIVADDLTLTSLLTVPSLLVIGNTTVGSLTVDGNAAVAGTLNAHAINTSLLELVNLYVSEYGQFKDLRSTNTFNAGGNIANINVGAVTFTPLTLNSTLNIGYRGATCHAQTFHPNYSSGCIQRCPDYYADPSTGCRLYTLFANSREGFSTEGYDTDWSAELGISRAPTVRLGQPMTAAVTESAYHPWHGLSEIDLVSDGNIKLEARGAICLGIRDYQIRNPMVNDTFNHACALRIVQEPDLYGGGTLHGTRVEIDKLTVNEMDYNELRVRNEAMIGIEDDGIAGQQMLYVEYVGPHSLDNSVRLRQPIYIGNADLGNFSLDQTSHVFHIVDEELWGSNETMCNLSSAVVRDDFTSLLQSTFTGDMSIDTTPIQFGNDSDIRLGAGTYTATSPSVTDEPALITEMAGSGAKIVDGDLIVTGNIYTPSGTVQTLSGLSWAYDHPPAVPSDARVKHVSGHVNGTETINRLLEIDVVEFEYTKPELAKRWPGQQMGVIAQQLEQLFPQAVKMSKQYPDIPDFRTVDYGALIPPLIASIRALALDVQRLDAVLRRNNIGIPLPPPLGG